MIIGSDYHGRVSRFILEYIQPVKKAYTDDGNLIPEAIAQSVRLLLKEGVFSSADDMKREAFQKYKIMLPFELFEEECREICISNKGFS